jgi:2-dehydrotetronate isomerase
MPAYVANTSFLFAERPSLDRFAAAAAAGFRAVECHYPSDIPAARRRPRPFRRPGCINTRNRMGDQRHSGLAAVPGDGDPGDRTMGAVFVENLIDAGNGRRRMG